jgi:hypothetical protein
VYGGPVLLSVNITIYCVTDLYVLLGAEEGMFTLQVNTTQDPVMEQVPFVLPLSVFLRNFRFLPDLVSGLE